MRRRMQHFGEYSRNDTKRDVGFKHVRNIPNIKFYLEKSISLFYPQRGFINDDRFKKIKKRRI